MSSQPLQELNIRLPVALATICQNYNTEIQVSRAVQDATTSGYGEVDLWAVAVYIIADICRHCGELRARVGQVPVKERCDRHSWQTRRPILIAGGLADDLADAIGKAETKAVAFLQAPEEARWKIEIHLDRREYLAYNHSQMASVKEFLAIYDELSFDARQTWLGFARTLLQADRGHIVGGE